MNKENTDFVTTSYNRMKCLNLKIKSLNSHSTLYIVFVNLHQPKNTNTIALICIVLVISVLWLNLFYFICFAFIII
jgi:hypothetical protein